MATTTMIHVHVEKRVRKQASDALETMGLSISEAVRVFLARVATEQRIPFVFRVPNAETWTAMEEARAKSSARFTRPDELFDDLEYEGVIQYRSAPCQLPLDAVRWIHHTLPFVPVQFSGTARLLRAVQ